MAELMVRHALATTAVLGTALLVLALTKRASPAQRHRFLVCSLLASAVVPFLHVALPSWNVLPHWSASGPQVVPPLLGNEASGHASARTPIAESTHGAAWWFGWIWIAGSVLFSTRLLAGGWRQRRLRARLARDADTRGLHAACARIVGLRRAPTVEFGPVPGAFAAGVGRRWVALPSASRHWPVERLRVVLLHEFAHVRRRDPMWRAAAALYRALHWWHPFAHLAFRAVVHEQEHAADDLVLAGGTPGPDYADHLLSLATGRHAATAPAVGAGSLESRLRRILAARRSRHRTDRGLGALATAAIALATSLVAPRLEDAVAGDGFWRPPGLVTNADGQIIGGRCSPDDVFLVYLMDAATIAVQGDVRFERGSAQIGPGGYLLVEQTRPASFDRVEIRKRADGTEALRHFRDGRRIVGDPSAARAWLARILPRGLASAPEHLTHFGRPPPRTAD